MHNEQEQRRMINVAIATEQTEFITLLLVDDHALMREGLRHLFEQEEDILVVGEAADGFDALQKMRQLRPGIVLLDANIPVVDGITLTRQITEEFPETAVILLAMHSLQQHMLQAMQNGARGYLSKHASVRTVVEAIRLVHEGGVYIEPGLTSVIVSAYRRLSDASSSTESVGLLTEKEIELIRYLAMGMSNKEIADRLFYSEKTVKNYLSIIFQKLHLRDRTQVAIFALRQGLLPHEEI